MVTGQVTQGGLIIILVLFYVHTTDSILRGTGLTLANSISLSDTSRQQTVVGGDLAAVEFQLQATVKIDPQMRLFGFTHRVARVLPVVMMVLH